MCILPILGYIWNMYVLKLYPAICFSYCVLDLYSQTEWFFLVSTAQFQKYSMENSNEITFWHEATS